MRVSIGDVSLYFEVIGREWARVGDALVRRPTVVSLHGGPGVDGAKLRERVAPLANAACFVVPDQRGHGASDMGAPETWNLKTWGDDVVRLCDVLGIEHPVVLGTSFGGFVVQRYAGNHPDHPAALILVATLGRFLTPEETIERFRAVGGHEAAEAMRRDIEHASEETAAEWDRVCGPLLTLHPDPLGNRLEAMGRRTMEVNLHFHGHEGRGMNLLPTLTAVRCPTLVLVGAADPLVPVEAAHELANAIPGDLTRVEVIPDAAHELFTDAPQATYAAVRRFLEHLDVPA